MKESQLAWLVHSLWDVDFGEPSPRPFHAALDYTGISKALNTQFYSDEAMESLMSRYCQERAGIRDEAKNPEAEEILFDLLYAYDAATDPEMKEFWFEEGEEVHTCKQIEEMLLERYISEIYINLGWKQDDGMDRIITLQQLMKHPDDA